MKDSISPTELDHLLSEKADIEILDVRLKRDRVDVEHPIPTAEWKDPEKVSEWSEELADTGEVIVFCVHGRHVSQSTRDALRRRGLRARIVEGGIAAWEQHVRESRETDVESD